MDTHQPDCSSTMKPFWKNNQTDFKLSASERHFHLNMQCFTLQMDNGRTLSECEIDNRSNLEKMKAGYLLGCHRLKNGNSTTDVTLLDEIIVKDI